MKDKLLRISLVDIVIFNSFIIFIYMIIYSINCPDSYFGGECVKEKDNFTFFIQMGLYLIFSIFYIAKINYKKWWILAIGFILTALVYTIGATLHSISKAGLY